MLSGYYLSKSFISGSSIQIDSCPALHSRNLGYEHVMSFMVLTINNSIAPLLG